MKIIINGSGRFASEISLTIDNADLDKDYIQLGIKQNGEESFITCLTKDVINALQVFKYNLTK